MTVAALLVGGLVLLVLGAEWLVRGASRLAAAAGVSPLAVGLTVVAYGTSAPELAMSLNAALEGQADLALGNVVGSNTCNVLLILGVSALLAPLSVSSQLVRLDVPLMVGCSLAVAAMAWDGVLSRWEGGLLVGGAIAYTAAQLVLARRERQPAAEEEATPGGSLLGSVALLAVGLVLLVLGSQWLVEGAVRVATAWGVSELVVGLTIVAVGTSLPELVTSVMASLRGERDIAVGNVVGSNLFNLTAVLGAGAIASPAGVVVPENAVRFDLPVMVGVAVICLPVFFTGMKIARWEGGLLLAYYAAYAAHLVLSAKGHDAARTLGDGMLWCVIPLTAVALAWHAAGEAWRRRRP